MGYQPFLIAPFTTGLDTDLEPWMLPQDAFQELVNGHIHHGKIEKRGGYRFFGDLVHQDQTNWTITAATQADPVVLTLTDVTGLNNGDVIEIRNVTGMTELNGNQYTVANVTGGAGGTLELSGINGQDFTAYSANGDVLLVPGNRVMGIEIYYDASNVRQSLAFDTKRACVYNSTNGEYDPLDSSDIMSGGDENYIWAANWASTAGTTSSTLQRIYFTNGKDNGGGATDGIRYYSGGTTTTQYNPQINSTTEIRGCQMIFAIRERLYLLDTFEGSNRYRQRLRWCQIQNPDASDAWDDNVPGKGGYNDAPTGDNIITARQLGDYIIVMMTNSVWMLEPTTDPLLPMRWVKLNNFRAADSRKGSVEFDRFVGAIGKRGIYATDRVESKRIDERIERFTSDEINAEEFQKVFARRNFEARRTLILYPDKESSDANRALVYDEESGAFSTYEISMNVLGYGAASGDLTLQDFGDVTLDDQNYWGDTTLQDYHWDDGSELFLGGDISGQVWELDFGAADSIQSFQSSIMDVDDATGNGTSGRITITGDIGLTDGDKVTFAGCSPSDCDLNFGFYTVENKSGNVFGLVGVDLTALDNPWTSGGTVYHTGSTPFDFYLKSAAWNPFKEQGIESQIGYVELYVDSDDKSTMEVDFYKNSYESPYADRRVRCLPNLTELATIVGITNANPGVVNAPDHGLLDNDIIYLYGVRGMDSVNGERLTVTVEDVNNFSIGIDTTNYGTYDSGGVVVKRPLSEDKGWVRAIGGGIGHQHSIAIESNQQDSPITIHGMLVWMRPIGGRMP